MSNLNMPRNDGRKVWVYLGNLHDKKWSAYATTVVERGVYAKVVSSDPLFERVYELIHHGVPIVTAYYDGTVVVNNHGWESRTTCDRINRALSGTGHSCRIRQFQMELNGKRMNGPMTLEPTSIPA